MTETERAELLKRFARRRLDKSLTIVAIIDGAHLGNAEELRQIAERAAARNLLDQKMADMFSGKSTPREAMKEPYSKRPSVRALKKSKQTNGPES